MHENNPFQNIKDYWGSYYSSITEGAVKDTLNDMGYYFTDEGKHAGKWVHEKTGKALSTNHAMEIAAERANRKKKKKGNKEADAAGPNPTDKDARKQGEESTHSEEVEHDGEQLDELSKGTYGSYIKRAAANIDYEKTDTNPENEERVEKKVRRRLKGIGHAVKALGGQHHGAGNKKALGEDESLFHKDSDRLLREHIRAEYEARGIYPTSREVQETYNHIVDLLEKTRASKRDEILSKKHGTSGTETGLKLTKQELRRQRAGYSPQDYGDPARTSREEGERQGAHAARRNKPTRISPSSIDDTKELEKQGFSKKMLDLITTGTGR